MKVVLFCGGLGTRLKEYSDTIPKPLVPIGPRPIIWHLMKYYAHYGHNEFILCLGYRGDMIKEYFLHYNEWISNDFQLARGGKEVKLFNSDIDDWKISFIDTGLNSNIGMRLRAVKDYLRDDPVFLANYSDGLSDLPLPEHIKLFEEKKSVATFVSVRPAQSFHTVKITADGSVSAMESIAKSDTWVNGGYFVLRREIFDYLHEGEELVEQPFYRLIAEQRLSTQKYRGFWAAMDTFKDKMAFDDMYAKGNRPWQVWK